MIYSIGHSTWSAAKFLDEMGHVQYLWDIRSHPTSKWEQFRRENMDGWMSAAGKKYEWHPELGGWSTRHLPLKDHFAQFDVDITPYAKGKFPKQRIGKQTTMLQTLPMWTNQGLWDYQFFMTLPEFMNGIKVLIERSRTESIAICCAELLWWKCHRSMVADYIVYLGHDIQHIMDGKLISHRSVLGNRAERYNKYVLQTWREYKQTGG